ncbi:hypothetical protein CWI36_2058p0010 [Hamiltosporidium magnivora]|uniref:Uncharacterized protein n=2 Tax=Hamiltosporidium TaxID=1176354 RepID=A0A4V2JU87_9MICR|nr:hypothetical protein CWI36_2058p0010 [Hamiltosporidium magnivora]
MIEVKVTVQKIFNNEIQAIWNDCTLELNKNELVFKFLESGKIIGFIVSFIKIKYCNDVILIQNNKELYKIYFDDSNDYKDFIANSYLNFDLSLDSNENQENLEIKNSSIEKVTDDITKSDYEIGMIDKINDDSMMANLELKDITVDELLNLDIASLDFTTKTQIAKAIFDSKNFEVFLYSRISIIQMLNLSDRRLFYKIFENSSKIIEHFEEYIDKEIDINSSDFPFIFFEKILQKFMPTSSFLELKNILLKKNLIYDENIKYSLLKDQLDSFQNINDFLDNLYQNCKLDETILNIIFENILSNNNEFFIVLNKVIDISYESTLVFFLIESNMEFLCKKIKSSLMNKDDYYSIEWIIVCLENLLHEKCNTLLLDIFYSKFIIILFSDDFLIYVKSEDSHIFFKLFTSLLSIHSFRFRDFIIYNDFLRFIFTEYQSRIYSKHHDTIFSTKNQATECFNSENNFNFVKSVNGINITTLYSEDFNKEIFFRTNLLNYEIFCIKIFEIASQNNTILSSYFFKNNLFIRILEIFSRNYTKRNSLYSYISDIFINSDKKFLEKLTNLYYNEVNRILNLLN